MAVQADGLLIDSGLIGKDGSLSNKAAFVDVAVAQQFLQAGVELIAVSLHAACAVFLDLADQRLDGIEAARHILFQLFALDGAHSHKGIHGLFSHRLHILPEFFLVGGGSSLGQHIGETRKHTNGDIVFQVHPLHHLVQGGAVALGQLPVDRHHGIGGGDRLDGKA